MRWLVLTLVAVIVLASCRTVPIQRSGKDIGNFSTIDDFDPTLLGNSNVQVIIPFGAGLVDKTSLLGNIWIVTADGQLTPAPLLDASLLTSGAQVIENKPNSKAFDTVFLKAGGSLTAKIIKQFGLAVSSDNNIELTGTDTDEVSLVTANEWDDTKLTNAAGVLAKSLKAKEKAIVIRSYDVIDVTFTAFTDNKADASIVNLSQATLDAKVYYGTSNTKTGHMVVANFAPFLFESSVDVTGSSALKQAVVQPTSEQVSSLNLPKVLLPTKQ